MLSISTYGELINRIQDSYNKEYNSFQIQDIEDYLLKRNFPKSALNNLYELITENNRYFPNKSIFKETIDNALAVGSVNISNGLHPQSPLQQLYRAKDWTADKIIKNCENIRNKQSQVGSEGLFSWEVSFLVIWERLKYVFPDMQEIAKKRIISNGDKELREPVNLNDLMPDIRPMQIPEERSKKIEKVVATFNDIF